MDHAKRRVLLVDGHVDAVDSLAMLLELYGHEVERCYDGALALEAALRFQPDVVLLDQRLPGVADGIALGRALLEDRRLAGLAVAVQTTLPRPGDQTRALDAGIAYLLKPAEPDDLVELVGQAAARCRQPVAA